MRGGPVLGRDHPDLADMTFVAPITCPRCHTGTGGFPMRHVENIDPAGWSERERRAILVCSNPTCGHTCVAILQLIDADNPGRTDSAL